MITTNDESDSELSVSIDVEEIRIDLASGELLIEWTMDGVRPEHSAGTTRMPLADALDWSAGEHSASVPVESVDASEAREYIAGIHGEGVSPGDVLIQRIDAPCGVEYDLAIDADSNED